MISPGSAAAQLSPRILEQIKEKTEAVFQTEAGREAHKAWEESQNEACAQGFDAVAERAQDQFHRITARFRAGRCYERSRQFDAAATAYEEVRAAGALLAPLATLRLAVIRHEQRRTDEALALAAEAQKDPVLRARAQGFRARILEVAGRDLPLAEGFETAITAGLVLKAAKARMRLGHKTRAIKAFKRVLIMSPAGAIAQQASELLRQLKPACFEGEDHYGCFTPIELVDLGRSLYGSHASKEAIKLLLPRLASPAFSRPETACPATLLVARSYTKLRERKNSLPHYAAARTLCLDRSEEPDVLYFQGVDAFRQDRHKLALDAFMRLHQAYPEHSYNDDAILYEAAAMEAQGDRRAADALIRKGIERYPGGDMRQELGWRYVWSTLKRGLMKQSLKRIHEIGALLPDAKGYKGRGRLAYWEARLLERSGKVRHALKAYEKVLASAPLSYHALLAYQRLRIRKGAKYATKALTAATAHDENRGGGAPLVMKGPPGRIALLVRMGLLDEAARELQRIGRSADKDALLVVAYLADQVGAHHLSVMILRRHLSGFTDLPATGAARNIWKLAYPQAFAEVVRGHSSAARVDPLLVWSIMREESGFVADIESWANAIGLMQLIKPTAEKMARARRPVPVSPALLRQPDTNVRLGVRYLKYLQEILPHPALIVAAYNAGEARVENWVADSGGLTMDLFIASIPYRQTRGYTMRVLQSWFRYQMLYGGGPPKLDMSKARVFRKTKRAKARR